MGFIIPGRSTVDIVATTQGEAAAQGFADPAAAKTAAQKLLDDIGQAIGEDISKLTPEILQQLDTEFDQGRSEGEEFFAGIGQLSSGGINFLQGRINSIRGTNLQEQLGGVDEEGEPSDITSETIKENLLDSLQAKDRSLVEDVLEQVEFNLDRPINANEADIVRSLALEGKTDKLSGSEISDQITSNLTSRESRQTIKTELASFEETLAGRQAEFQTQEDIQNAFIASGGLATPQTLAQLAEVTNVEEAQALAEESIAREEALEQGRIQEFGAERGRLSEELAGIGGRELELAQPEIEKRLQALGILRGGEQIRQTQLGAERLESERQRILAGFGREDILQSRGLANQFGQQARELALNERGQIAGNIQGVLSTQLGAQREDITGARGFQQQQGLLSQQLSASSREAERQRSFQESQAQLTREFNLKLALAGAAGGGSSGLGAGLGGIFGALAGGAIGSTLGPGGAIAGAKIGGTSGSLLGGFAE